MFDPESTKPEPPPHANLLEITRQRVVVVFVSGRRPFWYLLPASNVEAGLIDGSLDSGLVMSKDSTVCPFVV
jgi:hypothetical protein